MKPSKCLGECRLSGEHAVCSDCVVTMPLGLVGGVAAPANSVSRREMSSTSSEKRQKMFLV